MICFDINISKFKETKWTPRFSYNISKLEKWKNKISTLDSFIQKGPTNGIDARNFSPSGKNYIRILDLKRYFISYSDIKKINLDKVPEKIKLKKNDILISRKGTPGIAAIVTENNVEDIIGTEIIHIRLKDNINPYYFIGFLNSKFFYNQVISNLSGGNSVGINHPALKNLKILYDRNIEKKISEKVEKILNYENEANKLIDESKNEYCKFLKVDFDKIKNNKNFSISSSFIFDENIWTPKYSNPKYIKTSELISKNFEFITLNKDYIDIKKGFEPGSKNYIKYKDRSLDDLSFSRTSDFLNHDMDIYSDFYLKKDLAKDFQIDIKKKDILFSKDGKIGMTAMVCEDDNLTIASGISRLRLKPKAFEKGLSPEYLFLNLSLEQIGKYFAKRYTVVASTIPHLNQDHLYNFKVPIIDKEKINYLTKKISEAFDLKNKKKQLLKDVNEAFIQLEI